MSKINTNKEQPDLLGDLFKRIPEEELPASFRSNVMRQNDECRREKVPHLTKHAAGDKLYSFAAVVESVDTGDLKSPGRDTVRVRVPSAAPRRRGRHIVRGDNFLSVQSSPLTHSVAAPSKIEPTLLGLDLV